jgi:(p)ppGpp synthase/HD superfamily hydrolase
MKMLAKAIQIASTEFINSMDRGGKPYILHCLWVMDKVRHLGEKYMIVAVLHDLIEDTDWTIDRLKKEGFSTEICLALRALTHNKNVKYMTYIENLMTNDLCVQVKLRDLEHNSKITRLKGITEKDIIRMVKYHEAYSTLKHLRR